MKPKSIFWGEHTWEELAEIAVEGAVVVAPFGSVEQHGPMLPVDTDVRIAQKWAEDGAKIAAQRHDVPVLVLPTMPIGLASHHMGFAGTLTLEVETYVRVVAEILGCVVAHGFRKIAVVSGHGGNVPGLQLGMKVAVQHAPCPVRMALFDGERDPEYLAERARLYAGEPSEGQLAFHAARPETSQTLSDRPHLVRRDRMVKPQLKVDGRPEWAWETHEVTVTGATGDPSLARTDLGEWSWKVHAEAHARFIRRVWEMTLPEGGQAN